MPDQQISEDKIQAIGEALMAGRKIEAIKLYRDETGLDLKGSKDFIEKLGQQLAAEHPEKFAKAGSKAGCAGVILFAFVAGGGLVATLARVLC